MPLTIQVSLLSGRTASLEAEEDEWVGSFNNRAQKTLEVGRGRLVDSSASILNSAATLGESSLRSGDVLTLQMSSIVHTNIAAFAAILGTRRGGGGGGLSHGSCRMCDRSKHLGWALLLYWAMGLL